jgi:hypothetical protein
MLLLAFLEVALAIPAPREYNVGEATLVTAGVGSAIGAAGGVPLAIGANKFMEALNDHRGRNFHKINVVHAGVRDAARIGIAGGLGVAVGTTVANSLENGKFGKDKVAVHALAGLTGGAVAGLTSVIDSGPEAMLAGAVAGATIGTISGLIVGATKK